MIEIRETHAFGLPILQVRGSLEFGSVPQLLKSLEKVLRSHPRVVGLDLSEVDQIDVAGLVLLRTAAESLAEHGGRFRLLGSSPAMRSALGQAA